MQIKILSFLLLVAGSISVAAQPTLTETQQKAVDDIRHSIDVIDAAWKTSIKGHSLNTYMVDTYNTKTGEAGGTSDVWPYTAAIEAHCSLLEALEAAKDIAPDLYSEYFGKYSGRLNQLIDNLEFYRGTYTRPSYATTSRAWSPYAVPRARQRGMADVSGILNVYDDQMWIARELIRAYRVTGDVTCLEEAAYLADYILDGWDCWRDADGNEYGGITWGPGYNSKHACSNAPVIQPLVWLSDIYKDSDETVEYIYRDAGNNIVKETRTRHEHYLDFARRVYDWQKSKLKSSTGVYWDMMGADNTIKINDGYRMHVDCGAPTGSFFSYNTGTMIAGAAELYRVTGEQVYRDDLSDAARASLKQFAKYVRKHNTYEFTTDDTAASGFNTWFNDVLMRSYIDASPYCENSSSRNALNSFQTNLNYAFENHNRNNLLPIHLLDGWGDEEVTKGFHQFTFASEFAMLAKWLIDSENPGAGIDSVVNDNSAAIADDAPVYNITGRYIGRYGDVSASLQRGVYIVGSRKILIAR